MVSAEVKAQCFLSFDGTVGAEMKVTSAENTAIKVPFFHPQGG